LGLFVQSVNDVIDLNEKCRVATRNHLPEVTFLLLYAMAAVAVGFTGYGAVLTGTRQHTPNAIMALSIAVVIMLITDLDRPKTRPYHGGSGRADPFGRPGSGVKTPPSPSPPSYRARPPVRRPPDRPAG
jgi:hypothetical protein